MANGRTVHSGEEFTRARRPEILDLFARQVYGVTPANHSGGVDHHRKTGESIDHLILAFPYWFCPNYAHYLGRVDALPVDGHLLLALIAPRPVYVASGETDPYSDPEGEFLAARAVGPVYRLFGKEGVEQRDRPPLNHPIGGNVRYHIRTGGHDVTAFDWEQYLSFAKTLSANAH